MNISFSVHLRPAAERCDALVRLQEAFAQVCNELAPVVAQQRCWNRVALHHLMYRPLRDKFPALGSQMVCNAIYAVCRSARLVYQHPGSPFSIERMGAGAVPAPLPVLVFEPSAPVYFDRHTLSVKGDRLSMFTLEGRVRFSLALQPHQLALLAKCRLKEARLTGDRLEGFRLSFEFDSGLAAAAEPGMASGDVAPGHAHAGLPSYLHVETAS